MAKVCPQLSRRAFSSLACVCVLLVLAITFHQAIHGAEDAGHPLAQPCVLCHVSRTIIGVPLEAQRPVVLHFFGEAEIVLPISQPTVDALRLPFSRPPPLSLL